MILADSLQILENEAVRTALREARGYGILIGMIIMALVMFGALVVMNQINKNELKDAIKDAIMAKYIRLKMEKNYVEMIDACNDCIKGGIRIAKLTTELFEEFPGYDEERKAKELERFPQIAEQYHIFIDDRSSVSNTLDTIVERDMESITRDLNEIEQRYPKETTKYNEEHEKYLTNKTENNG